MLSSANFTRIQIYSAAIRSHTWSSERPRFGRISSRCKITRARSQKSLRAQQGGHLRQQRLRLPGSGFGFGFGFGSRPGGRQAAANSSIPHTLCCRLLVHLLASGWKRRKGQTGKRAGRKTRRRALEKACLQIHHLHHPSAAQLETTLRRQKKRPGASAWQVSEDELTASASAHRDFLLQTLHNVREQLSNPSPLVVTGAEAGIPEGIAEELADPVIMPNVPSFQGGQEEEEKEEEAYFESSTKAELREAVSKAFSGDFAG